MVAQSLYSPKELYSKNYYDLLEMIMTKGIDFDSDFTSHQRLGRLFVKIYNENEFVNPKTGQKIIALRSQWTIIKETPRFNYVKKRLANIINSKTNNGDNEIVNGNFQ